jgi:hypothetical protein
MVFLIPSMIVICGIAILTLLKTQSSGFNSIAKICWLLLKSGIITIWHKKIILGIYFHLWYKIE